METPRPQAPLRLAVNTQTPLVRLRNEALLQAEQLHLEDLLPDVDYKFTAGGVTRMMQPLLRRGLSDGSLRHAEWVALAVEPSHPSIHTTDGFLLSYVGMPAHDRAGYSRVKESLWAMLNAMPLPGSRAPGSSEWRAFDAYQARSARSLESAAERMHGADVYYVHDFQQMGVGRALRDRNAPHVFHLHTPFPSTLPRDWADLIVDHLADYDAVVCSTERYATNLRRAGLRTPTTVIPPFIDAREYGPVPQESVEELRARFGIAASDRVVLNIARMDPMKGQDRLLQAMPALLREVPEARLVLIGNGSFSSSSRGGLGLSKGAKWRARLEALAAELGVAERVTFTGHLDDASVHAALSMCDVFVLPSTREGFGLAVVEAWRYRKPVIVSDRAGIADFVESNANGLVVECGESDRLARALGDVLSRPDWARGMGEAGYETSRQATLDEGELAISRLFGKLREGIRARS